LKDKIKNIPESPGVYKFFSKKELIYIGKAKNLKKRTSSYFGKSLKDRKTNQIRRLTDHIEVFITNNEVEALLLEQNLIKENKPRFNILLRDDKTYPYIYFSLDQEFPGIYLKRTKSSVNKNYIGPFISSQAVKNSIKDIQKIFRIRNCSDSTFKSRTRPCIEFQMKRCSAPCTKNISKEEYMEDIEKSKDYLTSSKRNLVSNLRKAMKKASDELNYEKAADIKNRINQVEIINEKQAITPNGIDADIFSVEKVNNYAGICIVTIRDGKIRGTKTHLVKDAFLETTKNLYELAVFNFYSSKANLPKKVFFASPLDELFLIKKCIRDNISHKIIFPKTKNSFINPIVSLAKNNAAQIIKNHLSKKEKYAFAYKELSERLGVKKIERIDAFDISHQYMQQGVGSCVVFAESGASKKDYRLFNIPNDIAGNDVASMEHIISRRLKYYEDHKPDLILIDGGRAQLNFTNKILKNFDMEKILVLGIAKGKGRVRATETIYTNKGVIEIDPHSESFKLLSELRDESHRFAISASRKKIRKTNKYSALDSVKGIGPVTKKALLKKFKSLKGIKDASKTDLMTIKNINETMASEIKQIL
tara:strand:+ start:1110 stop:2882 length:1773 start_codon:yes stop_codon:yes gene_type:complete